MARRNAESSRKDEFPIGMRVLAVDDDVVCLRLLETLLKQCGYRVTVAQFAITALELLRENKNNYDLVISDVQMPDMDGFKLLEIIGLEMGLPVIMLSINGETNYVMKGVLHGAVDYLVKPVRLEDLRLIWKHVIKKSLHDKGDNDHGHSNIAEKKADNSQYLSASSICKDQTNEREDYAKESSDGELSKHKRPRVSWSTDLHARFIRAVNQLGFERAVPKRILELMNVQGITRENVASHLQKYRKTLKKNGVGLNQQYHAGPPVHSLRVDSPSSVIFSFNQQAHAKDSHRRAMPPLFHQCTSFSRANVSTGYVGYSTNSFGLERAHLSPGFNSFIHQPLTSTSDQVNAYAEKIHQNHWPYSGMPHPISSCQLECTSSQDSFGIFFENNNSGFNYSAEPALHYLDITAQTSGDILDMQGYDAYKPNDTCRREFAKNHLEDSSFDELFHINRCQSAADLNTILKQFQQSER